MREIGKYLLRKRSHAIVAALLFSIGSILFFPLYTCVAVIVALVTLENGPKEGLVVLLWAITPVVAVTFSFSLQMAVLVILLSYLTIWLWANVLAQYRSWSMVLELSAIVGVLAIVMVKSFFPDVYDTIGVAVTQFFKQRQKTNAIDLTAADFKLWIEWVSALTMGFAVLQLSIVNMLCLIISRAWQAKLVNPGGFIKEFINIRVGKLLSIFLLISVVAVLFNVRFALEIMPVLMLPYFFDALSLVHYIAENNPNKPAILGFLYLSCLIFYSIMFFGLTIIGIVDSWYDFRKKIVVQ